MKHNLLPALLTAALLCPPALGRAQTNGAVPALNAAHQDPASQEKHLQPVLAALKLSDPVKEARVHDLLAAQFKVLRDFHAQHDAQIKPLWNDFNFTPR